MSEVDQESAEGAPLRTLPLVVLAGSARKWERLAGDPDRLLGPKGITIKHDGRPLIDVVVERFHETGAFGPIFIAGPAAAYGSARGPAEVIDTDTDFAGNIRAAFEGVEKILSPRRLVFTTSDVIPDPDELKALVEDYFAHHPLDFWFPLVEVHQGAELGAAAGKRRYRVVPDGAAEPVTILPGHLVAVDPTAARLPLIYSSFELAYRSRTQPVSRRFLYIISHVLMNLLWADIKRMVRWVPPVLTIQVLRGAMGLAHGLDHGAITQREIEDHLRGIFIRRRHRRAFPDRRGRIPILRTLSLAKDIDTRREAEEQELEIGDPADRE